MLTEMSTFLYKRKRLEGPHHGTVVANDDPDKMGHVKVRVPDVLDGETDALPWAAPKFSSSLGGASEAQVFMVPKVGSSVIVEFDNPYSLYYCAWTPSDKTVNDLFHGEYPDRYGMVDGEFLIVLANRAIGDAALIKRVPTGESTLAYLGPQAEIDLATAGKIDISSVESTIDLRAKQDLNLETEGENEAEGSVFRIRGTLLMDIYDGLTIKSNGADLTVDTGGGNLTATTGEGSADVDVGGDANVTVKGNLTMKADGDIEIAASGNVRIKGSRIDLN